MAALTSEPRSNHCSAGLPAVKCPPASVPEDKKLFIFSAANEVVEQMRKLGGQHDLLEVPIMSKFPGLGPSPPAPV